MIPAVSVAFEPTHCGCLPRHASGRDVLASARCYLDWPIEMRRRRRSDLPGTCPKRSAMMVLGVGGRMQIGAAIMPSAGHDTAMVPFPPGRPLPYEIPKYFSMHFASTLVVLSDVMVHQPIGMQTSPPLPPCQGVSGCHAWCWAGAGERSHAQ